MRVHTPLAGLLVYGGNAKEWIKRNTYRINIVFRDFSKPLAHALEAHLHLLHEPFLKNKSDKKFNDACLPQKYIDTI